MDYFSVSGFGKSLAMTHILFLKRRMDMFIYDILRGTMHMHAAKGARKDEKMDTEQVPSRKPSPSLCCGAQDSNA